MKYKGYLIDLDGTIYRGKQRIPEAAEFISNLIKENLEFKLVTNNTTRTPEMVKLFLEKYHEINVSLSHIYTAAQATADYIEENKKSDHPRVYVIGEYGLKSELLKRGFIYDEDNPEYVVVGLDSDVTYRKLKIAALSIQKGSVFIGTNPDRALPSEIGLVPGAGSLISLLQVATTVEPIIIGKPQTIIMSLIEKQLELEKQNMIMFGDNYDTDIAGGLNFGIDSALVLTGVTTKEDLSNLSQKPTYVLNNLKEWNFV